MKACTGCSESLRRGSSTLALGYNSSFGFLFWFTDWSDCLHPWLLGKKGGGGGGKPTVLSPQGSWVADPYLIAEIPWPWVKNQISNTWVASPQSFTCICFSEDKTGSNMWMKDLRDINRNSEIMCTHLPSLPAAHSVGASLCVTRVEKPEVFHIR